MSLPDSPHPNKNRLSDWFTPRRLRAWRENLTGYLMIAPATLLIFMFGIFPVGFALFVSLHKWRLKRGDIIGLALLDQHSPQRARYLLLCPGSHP